MTNPGTYTQVPVPMTTTRLCEGFSMTQRWTQRCLTPLLCPGRALRQLVHIVGGAWGVTERASGISWGFRAGAENLRLLEIMYLHRRLHIFLFHHSVLLILQLSFYHSGYKRPFASAGPHAQGDRNLVHIKVHKRIVCIATLCLQRNDLVIMTFFQYYLELSNILCIFAPKYR